MTLKQFAGMLSLTLCATAARSADFSFTGSFTYDNDVQAFTFIVGARSSVTLRTWSYAGGVNAAGETIAQGGFDPVLALFDGDGAKIGEQDDGSCADVAPDLATGACYDTHYTRSLEAGSYTVTVMQFDNLVRGDTLAEGFLYDSEDFRGFRNGFVDVEGSRRNGAWAFDILNVNDAAIPGGRVPEPGSATLLGLGLAGLAAARRRKVRARR